MDTLDARQLSAESEDQENLYTELGGSGWCFCGNCSNQTVASVRECIHAARRLQQLPQGFKRKDRTASHIIPTFSLLCFDTEVVDVALLSRRLWLM